MMVSPFSAAKVVKFSEKTKRKCKILEKTSLKMVIRSRVSVRFELIVLELQRRLSILEIVQFAGVASDEVVPSFVVFCVGEW